MGTKTFGLGTADEWLRSPEPMSWRRTFSGRVDQVSAARHFASSLFAGSGHEDDVAFIVSELSSNAVRHTRSGEYGGWFGLELAYDGTLAYIGVTDVGGKLRPTVIADEFGACHAENGRGLLSVSNIAVAIGVHGSPEGGHTVWADVDLRGKPTPRPHLEPVSVS